VPAIVPVEFREDDLVVATPKEVEKRHHPISGKRRYIVGDRFHAKAEPHKSPLCVGNQTSHPTPKISKIYTRNYVLKRFIFPYTISTFSSRTTTQ
jgi:hypothetical protein